MPRSAHFLFCFALLAVRPAVVLAAPADSGDGTRSALREVAGILEYIAGDYRQAVSPDGRILLASEYAEQTSLASEASAALARADLDARDPLVAHVAAVRAALSEKAAPDRVQALCRDARELIVARHVIALKPSQAPSRDEAAQLYATAGCASCHGIDGRADTAAARALEPRPANFLDPARMAAVSPYRAFYAISAGVAGTAMRGFPLLHDEQRWSLAFYVLSLRHLSADLARGEREFARSEPGFAATPAALALLTDEDIVKKLGRLDPNARARVLGYLRARAPYQHHDDDADLHTARAALAAGLAAYRNGDRESARAQFVAAYLDGVEPHEATIAAHDRELVHAIEHAMLELREAAAHGATLAQIEQNVRASELLLLRANDVERGPTTALIGALTISVREGFEIALLIAALLALVRKRGVPELAKYVHAGWILAALAGLATFYAVGAALSGFSRELAEGIATLVAATVLLGVTHWMLGQLSAKRFLGFVAAKLTAAANRRTALGVLGLSFLATYREAFEVVLFFKALLLDAGEHASKVWLGVGLGLCALASCALVLKRIGQRLPLRPFMLVSSAVLSLLVFALTGSGVHALQMAGVIAIRELSSFELPWLGIYATAQTLIAQAIVLAFLIGSAIVPLLTQRDASAAQPAE